MVLSQESVEMNLDSSADIVASILKDKFELQQSNLTGEQASLLLSQTIQGLPVEGMKIISIIGGPASGKGILVNSLIGNLNQSGLQADTIGTDDYALGTRAWRWEREKDDPLSLKDFSLLNRHVKAIKNLEVGETVAIPVYDQPTGLAIEVGEENFPHKVGKVNVLFVEGDFDAVENPDFTIFIDVPMEARLQARVKRDLTARGETDAGKIASSFKARHIGQYLPHTAPAIAKADLVLKVTPDDEVWQYDVYSKIEEQKPG